MDLTAGFQALSGKWDSADAWLTQMGEAVMLNAGCLEHEQKKVESIVKEVISMKTIIQENDLNVKQAMVNAREETQAAIAAAVSGIMQTREDTKENLRALDQTVLMNSNDIADIREVVQGFVAAGPAQALALGEQAAYKTLGGYRLELAMLERK